MKKILVNMMLGLISVGLLLALLAASFLLGRSTGPSWRRPPHRPHQIRKFTQALDLNEKQLQGLRVLKRRQGQKLREHMRQMHQLRRALVAELQKDPLDRKRIQQLHQQEKRLKMEFLDIQLQGMLYMREHLTPEQFNQMMQIMHHKAKGRKGVHR
jgi:Spy/CpxP family protein refolding chaperone